MRLIEIFLLLQIVTSCKQPEPETYLIPDGFQGKVNVIFNQSNGAAPKYDHGRRVYEIPSNGVLLTQFKDEEGIIDHKYYYVSQDNEKRPLRIYTDADKDKTDSIGVFRDGTVGVYGDSKDPKSLSFQAFYVSNRSNLGKYFSFQNENEFDKKVMQTTGYHF